MKLDEETKEKLRTMTVEVVLDTRFAYMRTTGFKPLTHWDQLSDRMRAAERTSSSVEEWTTSLMRWLQISTPTKDGAGSMRDLAAFVREHGCSRAWLTLVRDEWAYLIALARGVSEQRAEMKKTKEVQHG